MKTKLALVLLGSLVWSCHRKTVAAEDIAISNKPVPSSNPKKETSARDLLAPGQTVYTNRCGRCHGLKKTENYTSQQWDTILKSMVPKARLNNEEAKQVRAYVIEHSKT